jgi:hypothetical protein
MCIPESLRSDCNLQVTDRLLIFGYITNYFGGSKGYSSFKVSRYNGDLIYYTSINRTGKNSNFGSNGKCDKIANPEMGIKKF